MAVNPNKIRAKLDAIKENERTSKLRGLPGLDGQDGKNGKDGIDGREIELGRDDTHIQWRYIGEPEWRDLIAIDELKGDKPRLGVDYFVMHGKDGRDGRNGVDAISVSTDSSLEDSSFTYSDGLVTRIDYADGQYKTFIYNGDSTVHTLTWYRISDTVTKVFTYNGDGTVASITVTIT